MTEKQVVVVGGGLAGLAAALKLAENGCLVKLVSVTNVKRSHSVCAQGGINAAMNPRGQGDSPMYHAYETIKGGDFLADQPPIVEMCLAAPKIINMLDRFGCPFNRTDEGTIAFRGFGGTLMKRSAFCGGSTGQQLLYALDEQVRRWEVKGRVEKFEFHEFLRVVLDEEGRARGIVAQDLFNLRLHTLKADAVVIATGGPGLLFSPSTNSTFCTGAANARCYMQGMHYANGEFIQIHPTAIPGEDKSRLISESVRGEGGRVWVWGDSSKTITAPSGEEIPCGTTGEKWYFFEELYPAYGNLVPRDIAARTIMQVTALGLGVDGQNQVFLDVTHLPASTHQKLESVLDIYEKFAGEDPRTNPMRIFPAVHYSMGGGWVDWPAVNDPDRATRYRQMTNIPGLFNVGESDHQYHGANRLGANSLMSCIFGGLVTGVEVPNYIEGLSHTFQDIPEAVFDSAIQQEESLKHDLMNRDGTENIYKLHDELSSAMVRYVTVWRDDEGLQKAVNTIKELRERYQRISLDDHGRIANQGYIFANQFQSMLELSLVIAKSALLRTESRGAHHRANFQERDDESWLKTSIAAYDPKSDEPKLFYGPIDLRHLDPTPRDYVHKAKAAPEFKNMPDKFELPL